VGKLVVVMKYFAWSEICTLTAVSPLRTESSPSWKYTVSRPAPASATSRPAPV